ncbi:MAG: prolyl oligopeptidase family serine peptidase [Saprospiraceae bacterium]|nr:prolyl oligopeptidase family serine peptidase [Saprospiraceae bacterium]
MKKLLLTAIWTSLFLTSCFTKSESYPLDPDQGYTLVIEGFDWGAAASKVILTMQEKVSEVQVEDFEVHVKRATDCSALHAHDAEGRLRIHHAYVSDEKGATVSEGKHVTLVLVATPHDRLNAPMMYFGQNPKCPGNRWLDFNLSIRGTDGHTWDKEINRIMPLIDDFDLSGRFTQDNITLSYASFAPANVEDKRPLIIWLHGGGEGGDDPSIALIANRAANYAAPEIQAYFEGAHVLVPQSPTFWMDNGKGQYTRGEVDDMYHHVLMALIKEFVRENQSIDPNRIYIGGCSNGGYMTLKLLLEHPDYFAAAFPSALAYFAENLNPADINRIKDIPIWFIHSKDDEVTAADQTVVPVYHMLMEAGAGNVHFSFFDHVVDITNQFGGNDHHYNGHFSWIYSHTNKCQLDFDGKPVKVDGQPITLMGWLASQKRAH